MRQRHSTCGNSFVQPLEPRRLLATVVLQPGPADGNDIWTTSVYSYAPGGSFPGGGLNNDQLRVGGWADSYYSLLQFNLSSLPKVAHSATLSLYSAPRSAGTSATGMYLDRITQAWDWKTMGTGRDHDRLWWADRPAAVQYRTTALPAPADSSWYIIDLTTLYNSWQSGAYSNYGIQLRPVSNNNNFDTFYSSDYLANPTLRPKLTVVTPSGDPDDQISEAKALGTMSATRTSSGTISEATDVDMHSFSVTAGQRISFDIDTATNGPGGLGSYLRVFNSAGAQLAFNNDAKAPDEATVGFDSYVEHTFTSAGTYYVGVSSWQNTSYSATAGTGDFNTSPYGTGAYQLIVKPVVTAPTVTITASDANASEPGTDTGKFTVSRTGSTAASLLVKYTISGTATNGTDYNSLSGSVTIPAGAASTTVTVTPKDDTAVELSETAVMKLTADSGYVLGAGNTATVNIHDNDYVPPPIGSADMIAHRPQMAPGSYAPFSKTSISDGDENSITSGPGIRINGDDDNANGKADREDTGIANENDLVEVELRVRGGNYILERYSPNLRVWSSRTKSAGTEIIFTDNKSGVVLSSSATLIASRTVWVEWSQPGHGNATLRLKPAAGQSTTLPQDSAVFHTFRSIVVAFGGRDQVPATPLDANHGAFKIGTTLYRQGYDVRLYDEEKVASDGTGTPYNEIKAATQAALGRSVTEVAALGYSWGGGAMFNLVKAINSKLGIKATMTGYIDAIQSGALGAESRRPAGSAFHVNYYQTKPTGLVRSAGAPTVGLLGTDVQKNLSGVGVDHYAIDDDDRTQSGFVLHVQAKLLR